jgi:predicted DCC family thiol-disulfide oxidoreductase YuxK
MPDQAPIANEAAFLVYDGQCPLCQLGAKYYRIRAAVGELHLIDARTQADHWVMRDVNRRGLDIDQGMVFKFKDRCYHGVDALHVMALLGTDAGWFNGLNARLFRSKRLSAIAYPVFCWARTAILRLRGIENIANLAAR